MIHHQHWILNVKIVLIKNINLVSLNKYESAINLPKSIISWFSLFTILSTVSCAVEALDFATCICVMVYICKISWLKKTVFKKAFCFLILYQYWYKNKKISVLFWFLHNYNNCWQSFILTLILLKLLCSAYLYVIYKK